MEGVKAKDLNSSCASFSWNECGKFQQMQALLKCALSVTKEGEEWTAQLISPFPISAVGLALPAFGSSCPWTPQVSVDLHRLLLAVSNHLPVFHMFQHVF